LEPILDESSLVQCSTRSPAARIEALAHTLQALDGVGAVRVLRSVRDAPDRELRDGRGLRGWCFDRETPRDAGRLLAARLDKQPYIDGDCGLFASAEGARAAEATMGDQPVFGLGLAAMTDAVAVALASDARPAGGLVTVDITYVDDAGQRDEHVDVLTFMTAQEVNDARQAVADRVDQSVANGATIVARIGELFPQLRLGADARTSIEAMTGSETVFRQLIRHLRALDEGARVWTSGAYTPVAVSFSVESEPTLNHGTFGPQREFPAPDGFVVAERWSLHTKLTGGNGARIYFRAERVDGQAVVLVGYFGPHLDTVRHH